MALIKVVADIEGSKTIGIEYMGLARDTERIALIRQEDATRTLYEFEKLVSRYDEIEKNRVKRERKREVGEFEDFYEIDFSDNPIIPAPLEHIWWRTMLKGDFLDVIFDCPYEIQELTASRPMYELLNGLKEGQKEIFYFMAVRRWKPQRIAAMRGQTDRNILKVYAIMVESLRYKLYMRLLPRFVGNLPLTVAQRKFVESNFEKYGNGKSKRERKKKIADGVGDECT